MEREWPRALKCDVSGGANRRAPGLVLRLERPGRKARGSLPPAAPTSRLQTTPRALLSGGSSRSRPYLFIVPFPRPTKRAAGLAVLPLQRGCPLPPTGAAPSAPAMQDPPPWPGPHSTGMRAKSSSPFLYSDPCAYSNSPGNAILVHSVALTRQRLLPITLTQLSATKAHISSPGLLPWSRVLQPGLTRGQRTLGCRPSWVPEVCSSSPGLYPGEARRMSLCPSPNPESRESKMSPDFAKCPLEGRGLGAKLPRAQNQVRVCLVHEAS